MNWESFLSSLKKCLILKCVSKQLPSFRLLRVFASLNQIDVIILTNEAHVMRADSNILPKAILLNLVRIENRLWVDMDRESL